MQIWKCSYGKSKLKVPDTETSSIGEYWNTSGVAVLPINVICTFFRTSWWHPEANTTGMHDGLYCPILVYQYLGLEVHFFP